jgi:MFS superfamily sulfate permease-like transporter
VRADQDIVNSFEVGLMTFLLGIFRLGFLDAVLSRALLRGFITAVAFVILIEQLSKCGRKIDRHELAYTGDLCLLQ